MKLRWILILVAVCVIGIVAGFLLTRKPEGFVAYAWDAVWAKQGQTLYYSDHDGKSWRFDTKTGEKRVIGKNVLGSDIFPDDKRQISIGNRYKKPVSSSLYIDNIITQKSVRILQMKEFVMDAAFCLSNRKILFVGHSPTGNLEPVTIIADTDGNVLSKLSLKPEIVASDGSGFIYEVISDKYFLYDIAKKKSVRLKNIVYPGVFLYLSSKLAVYTTFDNNKDQILVKALDLKTNKLYKLNWPTSRGVTIIGPEGRISPNLTKYWYAVRPIGEWSTYQIDLLDIPESSVKILKRIEGK